MEHMKRPRNGYHVPDPASSWDDALPSYNAMVQPLSASEPERGQHIATLWVPDIEKPHGWAEVWIRRPVEPREERRMGFR